MPPQRDLGGASLTGFRDSVSSRAGRALKFSLPFTARVFQSDGPTACALLTGQRTARERREAVSHRRETRGGTSRRFRDSQSSFTGVPPAFRVRFLFTALVFRSDGPPAHANTTVLKNEPSPLKIIFPSPGDIGATFRVGFAF